jgi:hypothetical protein
MFDHTENVGYFDISDISNCSPNLNKGNSIVKEVKEVDADELLVIEKQMA